MPIIPTRDGADFSDESDRLEEVLENSEDIGEVRKRGSKDF
jgi:hypothetical protein